MTRPCFWLAAIPLALSSLPACYRSHELGSDGRDGGDGGAVASACTSPGSYSVQRTGIESTCGALPRSSIELSIPPRVEDFGSECTGTVSDAGACRWQLDAECAIPDNVREIHAVIEARSGDVQGEIEIIVTGFSGRPCRIRERVDLVE